MPVEAFSTLKTVIPLLKQRDKQGFNLLYEHYAPILFGLICKMTRDSVVAEDLLQETFVKVWKNIDQYDEEKASFLTWLVNIARYTTIDYLRSKGYKQQQKNQKVEHFEYVDKGHVVMPNTEATGLKKLVSKMEPKYRDIIDLIYFGGYTQEEVASILAIPLGTVKTRTRYALQMLRKKTQIYG